MDAIIFVAFYVWNLFADIMSKTIENSTFRQDNCRISRDIPCQ
jgi:hypothetical protein